MSYSCLISFKQMEAVDVFPFFKKLKSISVERLEQIAKENCHYCPFTRNDINIPKDFGEISREKREEAKSWAVQNVFHYRYFYDNELKLLGVYGVPTCVRDLFDKTVCFQNSCDQNYARKDWEGITVFEEIYDKWMNAPMEEVVQKYNAQWEYNDFLKEYGNDVENQLLYYRQSYCYDEIWEKFEYTLYDDNAVYMSMFGPYDHKNVFSFVKMCHQKYVEWEEEFEKEFNK